MKLTRQDLDELLVDYLYDELEPARRAAFEQGLAVHPELVAAVEAHRRTRTAAAALPSLTLPAGLLDGALAEARQTVAKATPQPSFLERAFRFLNRPAFASALLAVVVVGVGVLWLGRPLHPDDDPNRQRLAPVVATRAEGAAEVRGAAAPLSAPAPPAAAEGALAGDSFNPNDKRDEGADGPATGASVVMNEPEAAALDAAKAEKVAVTNERVVPAAPESKTTASKDAPRPNGQGLAAAGDRATGPKAEVGAASLDLAEDGRAPVTGFASTSAQPAKEPRVDAPAADRVALGGATADDAGPRKGVSRDAVTAPMPPTPTAPPTTTRTGDAGGRALREVPIAVPNDGDKAWPGRRESDDAAEEAESIPAPAARPVETTAAPVTDRGAAPEPPSRVSSDRSKVAAGSSAAPAPPGPAAAPAEVERSRASRERDEDGATKKDSGEAAQTESYRAAASRDAEAAQKAQIAELWRRYERAVAAGRWADAEAALDLLAKIPSEIANVRERRPQLAKLKAAADGAEKQGTTSTPAVDTYK